MAGMILKHSFKPIAACDRIDFFPGETIDDALSKEESSRIEYLSEIDN